MILETLGRVFYIVPTMPKTAQICITNECNFNCAICQRRDLGVEIKGMNFDDFKRIVDRLLGVKDIILTGWGEPLFYPKIVEAIEYCSAKGFKTRLTTNGALLNEDKANKLIEAGLDAITFSLDQIKNSDDNIGHIIINQLRNIKMLRTKIKERKSLLKIYTQSVYQLNGENNILDVVNFAIENDLDKVRISRLDIRFKKIDRPNYQAEKMLIKKIEQRIKNTKIELDFLPHTAFRGWKKIVYKIIRPFLHCCGKYCLRTYNDIYINENGMVTPCCALPNVFLGNIFNNKLRDIWLGAEFKNFRRQQAKICGKCDVLALKLRNK